MLICANLCKYLRQTETHIKSIVRNLTILFQKIFKTQMEIHEKKVFANAFQI